MDGKLEELLLNKESIIRKYCIFKLEISLLFQELGKTARKNFRLLIFKVTTFQEIQRGSCRIRMNNQCLETGKSTKQNC